jgi:hypothetical protein
MPAPLPTLREKLARRKKARNRQAKLWRRTKKAGHGKAAKDHTKAIKKLQRLIRRAVNAKPKSGQGPWGGCKSIAVNEVIPVGKRWGIPVTSRKRSQTYGNPSSDHYIGNQLAYAVDFATDSNYAFGMAIGRKLGVPYNGINDDYKSFYINRAGHQFRVQVICSTHGTGPHTHVGIRRV